MMLKIRYVLFLTLFSIHVNAQETIIKFLSGTGNNDTVNWDFKCTAGRNSGTWTTIPVPSNWEFFGFGNYTYGSEKEDKNEAGLYRYKFTVPAGWKDKVIKLVFDGSMTDTEVKINGQLAGEIHQGAFYRFKYDITNLLKVGQENLLEVTVHKVSSNQTVNEAERTADFWVFGGIFRPVFLEAVPKTHLNRVAIDAKADGNLTVDAYPLALNPGDVLTAQVKTLDGKLYGQTLSTQIKMQQEKVQLKGQFLNPALWSSEFPNLYQIEISLKRGNRILHQVSEKIGFRTIELRKHDGFYVNGQKIKFKGVNRGCFWPTTGRTTNKKISIDDANLIKDMNMNAVRMSHYPPDQHFLEVCDSLGLYVIDELTSWQYPPYDTEVGRKLVKELIVKDVNHPCIVMWANGNEGGFNFDLLPDYPKHDLQKRPVIQPWMNINGMNTKHYIPWNYGVNTFFQGNDVFFPTEFLHGLYDGGHGAGLDDYWNLMLANPLSAGGFLWDFCDQAAVRTDMNNFLDTKGNAAADGILGPYREKEGSFFTIKEIWNPVFLEKKIITEEFDGILHLENRYHFTNLNRVQFSWKLKKINSLKAGDTSIVQGSAVSPNIQPQAKGVFKLNLPLDWKKYDVLYLTAKDLYGRELYTWSMPVISPMQMTKRLVNSGTGTINVEENDHRLSLSASGATVTIDMETGLLIGAKNSQTDFPLSNGPVLLTEPNMKVKIARHYDTLGTHIAEFSYEGKQNYKIKWTMLPSGWLELRYQYRPENNSEMLGVTFNFPEADVKGMQLLGDGPYRVYKNRMKGVTFNSWTKVYNNGITGENWEYPEFKGYYSNFYGANVQTKTGSFNVLTSSDNVFLHMLNPALPKGINRTNSTAVYPAAGGISFMQGITAIGTKSQKKEDLGPQSQFNLNFANGGLDYMYGVLYFDFR